MSRLAHALVLLLKGTPFTLFGDEIELEGKNEIENTMQWSKTALGCGFTDHEEVGNFFQSSTNCANAGHNGLIDMYRNLTKLREGAAFSSGDIKLLGKQEVIAFTRSSTQNNQVYLVLVNTSDRTVETNLDMELLPGTGSVAYSFSSSGGSKHKVGENLDKEEVSVSPGELLVVKFMSEE